MNRYAILANPGHNRIYFETALKIAVSELEAIAGAYDMEINEIEEGNIGLPASICFSTNRELKKEDFRVLGFSSIFYALFEIVEGDLLRPISVPDFHTFPESMVQILKYAGKTNEQFTRLMVNLALSACNTGSDKITLFDPMCGKGTTLYEGFIRGFDVKGVEINGIWTQEIQTYVVRFLKEGRYKHKAQKSKQSDSKGKKIANIFSLTAAAEKADFNAGNVQTFELFNADTRKANLLMKKKSCDIIISDLPYGVQHGSKNDKDSNMSRSALGLLKEAIPAWYHVLKTKGSIVLSYNEFTMKYDDVADVLEENGFKVLDESPFNNYLHRVDQSINRNLIVAVKG
ncbi:TRM11 family SAM-dependent methyltransferase [Oceanirhabdus sp. W0125-5]|uniref:TRM11 family SAM-dependent methyltransferase n=1 Tax=Oceanirhabdus sp. W0125-5 TaxID=2999116 RepID=UPI0022F2C5F8|nr:DNA methylase [Oceanirhabdus sp. W0125-5]WBW97734.1 DNA methylase [Oceanirhabdus sp. W0125-5]